MVVFKWQPETGKYWLMEINGRFWGSLPLAYAAGADFPKMLFDLLVLKQRPESKTYRKNVYCRKLTADLYWLEQVLRRNDCSGLVRYPDYKTIISDSLLLFHPTRHFFDIQCWYDPLPGVMDLSHYINQQILRVIDIFRLKLRKLWHNSPFVRYALQRKLSSANNILFLCYGNINRSALAQRLAEQIISINIHFTSAGFHKTDKRPADPNMVNIATKNNIDLHKWKSTTLTEKLVNEADVILVMEFSHLDRLYDEYPASRKKSFLLGGLSKQSPVEIQDPYNQEMSIYENVFNQIRQNIDEINRFFKRSKP